MSDNTDASPRLDEALEGVPRAGRRRIKGALTAGLKRTVIETHPTKRTTERAERVDASVLIRGLTKAQQRRVRRYADDGPYEETIAGRRWRFSRQADGRIGVVEVGVDRPGPHV